MGCAFGTYQNTLLLQLNPKRALHPQPREAVFPFCPASFQAGIGEFCYTATAGKDIILGYGFSLLSWPLEEAAVHWRLCWFMSPAIKFQLKFIYIGLHLSTLPQIMTNSWWTSTKWTRLCFHLASRLPWQSGISLIWPSLNVLFWSWKSQSCLKKLLCFRRGLCGNIQDFSDAKQEGCSPCWWDRWCSPWGAWLLMMCKSGCWIGERLESSQPQTPPSSSLQQDAPCHRELLCWKYHEEILLIN